jgi:LPS-assembly lipoprotein
MNGRPARRLPMFADRLGAVLLGVLLAAALAGCGFHLRGVAALPFERLYVAIPPASTLGAELRRTIRIGTSTRVVENQKDAEAVLEVTGEAREKEIASFNAQGQAREYELRYRLSIRVHDGKGHEFLPATPLLAQRDISYNDSQVLAKETEEALLYRDMQSDLVQQVLRRLAAIPAHAGKS